MFPFERNQNAPIGIHCTIPKEEKELFRFLYLRKRDPGETLLDDANYDTTVELLSRNLEMPLELAKEMHRQMQYRCYGLGVMLATNYRDMSEGEISREVTSFYCIILRHYKAISREEELQYWLNRSRNLILRYKGGYYGKTKC